MNFLHPAKLSDEELLKQSKLTRTRRSGPGGQHRNKVQTAVVLEHSSTGVMAEASERRTGKENLKEAVFRLRVRLAIAVRSDVNDSKKEILPSELWKSRCKAKRITVSKTHRDFPSLLAEALDAIFTFEVDPVPAAKELGISTSQLIKFLKIEPAALLSVNNARKTLGKHVLN